MKTIAQFVEDGIGSLPDLKAALQTAMQLEFSTLPPYLCAQWSIKDDPGGVGNIIRSVVVQEMYHFALAGNMLSAIGGTPSIDNAAFIPSYPTHVLPGGIPQQLAVDLQPLTPAQVQVFMQIEYPEFPPVALAAPPPPTIGAFYNTIARGFTAVNPAIDSKAFAINFGEATPITSVADALAAISLVKGEGEGTKGSPEQPPQGQKSLAHYYLFKQIYTGKTLVQDAAGNWSFTGDDIPFPTCFDFKPSTASPSPSLAVNQAISRLLSGLQECWTNGDSVRSKLPLMFQLEAAGTELIQQGIRPDFLWAPGE